MARINIAAQGPRTHEGGPAVALSDELQLRRAVLACLLWENGFYESGVLVADRIKDLVAKVDPQITAALARQARREFKLRHVPLLLARELLRHSPDLVRKYGKPVDVDHLIADVCNRADEPAELLALYWANGKKPLANALKRGLAMAVNKFDAYQVAKWRGDDKAVKFKDVLFMTHAKPKDNQTADIWNALIAGTLPTPDTWEVALSAGADKKATFERLIGEGKLGYMALLRNLRNMAEAGVDQHLVHGALVGGAQNSKALPFRFLAAARAVPQWEHMLDEAMQIALTGLPRLEGRTRLLVDGSYSMSGKLSAKSDLSRLDAGKALAILLRGVCDEVTIYRFNNTPTLVPSRTGMALADALGRAGGGTLLGDALRKTTGTYDRTIVITDEQSQDAVGGPIGRGYMLNVASEQPAVGYGDWTRITGFSEAVVSFIAACEAPEGRYIAQ